MQIFIPDIYNMQCTQLNNVLAGGRTAFPILGFSVTPVKGSIVMWCSLKRNGKDIEKRSYHGGCPVMLGTKWGKFMLKL